MHAVSLLAVRLAYSMHPIPDRLRSPRLCSCSDSGVDVDGVPCIATCVRLFGFGHGGSMFRVAPSFILPVHRYAP